MTGNIESTNMPTVTILYYFQVADIEGIKMPSPETNKPYKPTTTTSSHMTRDTQKSFSSHEYGNISQRSQRLFEEPQLLLRTINSTNNCSLALRLSVCLLYRSMNMVTASMQLPPQVPGWTEISIGNGNT